MSQGIHEALLRVIMVIAIATGCSQDFPVHREVVSTIFWIGEEASADNDYIANDDSAWDNEWRENYGGVDDPLIRNGFYPKDFIPRENPFYVALPFNDFKNGKRNNRHMKWVYWKNDKRWSPKESLCKNRWVKIMKGEKAVYAQWEDVGPVECCDAEYVFGNSKPRNIFGAKAGIDVSPAVATYLGLRGVDKVNWQFVEKNKVPDGPWKEIVTISQVNWEKSE